MPQPLLTSQTATSPLFDKIKEFTFGLKLSNILPFTQARGFDAVRERVARGAKNAGFTDAGFQAMLKEVGWRGGQAWCAYFVKLVYMQFFSFDREWIAKNFTGSAMGNFYHVERLNKSRTPDTRYIAIRTNTPQICDMVCWGIVGKGHTGIITKINEVRADGTVMAETIEGNTSVTTRNEGGRIVREGEGSSFKLRKLKIGTGDPKLVGYVRRNFTPEERAKLYFDEAEQTLKFRTT